MISLPLTIYIYIGNEPEILRRQSLFDVSVLMNSSGLEVEHSSGSLIEEKSLFFDNGDGFGDEGSAGEMIGMLFGHKISNIYFNQITIMYLFCYIKLNFQIYICTYGSDYFSHMCSKSIIF